MHTVAFEIRAWHPTDTEKAERADTRKRESMDPIDTESEKREAIRILHREMRELGEGARGSVWREGFGFVVQQRLERDPATGRLEFVNEEL